ncbi:GNAT family N-acetyltransferase [Ornithinimicrobium avium]|uniref:GNAT family N-acetyltransferase n=1 Tax=Ornithinimicrobium avium TaxID=2283195 RepID=A0A345NMC3_9MICO|nr:GNAT family N-acetyltransferase [Ornithinimicrobium avium]AXH96181.1 GNAT family N-acetyltransferase [Ornithinimicrobium avium]
MTVDHRRAGATHHQAPRPRPATVTLRRAGAADADTVQRLVEEIAAHEGDLEHVQVTAARWRELLDRDDVVVLLAEREGRAVGFASAVRRLHLWSGGDLLAVDDVFVRADARDGGVGRQLLLGMAQLASGRDLLITWGVETDNTGAQRFYRRLGAALRPKVLARWAPAAYRPLLGQDATGGRA